MVPAGDGHGRLFVLFVRLSNTAPPPRPDVLGADKCDVSNATRTTGCLVYMYRYPLVRRLPVALHFALAALFIFNRLAFDKGYEHTDTTLELKQQPGTNSIISDKQKSLPVSTHAPKLLDILTHTSVPMTAEINKCRKYHSGGIETKINKVIETRFVTLQLYHKYCYNVVISINIQDFRLR